MPLLDREREIAALEAACREAAAGRGALLAIEGPAGIGKTALLGEVRRAAARAGFHVLAASGSELERDLAFGVARQLFERLLRDLPPDELGGLLSGAAALAEPALLDPAPAPAAEAVHAALHGLYWLAAELAARQPLLLVVDDGHWADAASLRWLAYLRRRLDGVPLLTVVARRDAEPGVEAVLLEGGSPAPAATVVRPRPLGEAAIARWLAEAFQRTVADELVRACAVATGGNPFLLRELTTSLVKDGLEPDAAAAPAVAGIAPASIARAVLVRLAPLGAEAVAVAEAAATLGPDARLDRVAALAGIPVDRAAQLAGRLAAADILEDADPLVFRHPILRCAVHGQTPRLRRGLAHVGAARLLLLSGVGPERAASHLLGAPAGGREWVSTTLREAAATALARGAPDASVSLLRRALHEDDGAVAETLIELSAAEFTVQDPAAIEHALAGMTAATTPRLRVQAGLAAARALTPLGRYDEALDVLRVVERESEGLDAASRQAVRSEALILTSWHRGVTVLAEPLMSLGVDALPGDAPEQRMLIALRTMEAVSRGGPRTETLELARRVLGHADPSDPDEESAVLTTARAMVMADAIDEAEPVFTAVLDGGRARGAVATVATAGLMRAEARSRAGRLAEAESDAREALDIAAEHELGVSIPAAVSVLVDVLLDRAPPERAAELVGRFDGIPVPSGYPSNMISFARGRVAAATGELDTAITELETCRAGRTSWGEVNPASCPCLSQLALALAGLGHAREAAELAAEELEHAHRFGAPRAIGIAQRGQALLGRGEAQIAGLRAAAHTLAASPARLEHARTLLELGAALRRSGHRTEARHTLSIALDACHACGAYVLAARARAELRTAGARPRRERLSGPEALTAGELRVAELAATGLTNRQIAQTLFLTSKTVETHLSHVYPKLGISRRVELAGKLRAG